MWISNQASEIVIGTAHKFNKHINYGKDIALANARVTSLQNNFPPLACGNRNTINSFCSPEWYFNLKEKSEVVGMKGTEQGKNTVGWIQPVSPLTLVLIPFFLLPVLYFFIFPHGGRRVSSMSLPSG